MALCVIALDGGVAYKWQILFKTNVSGQYCSEQMQEYLEQLLPKSGYQLCPGLREYSVDVRFKTKNLREWGMPFGSVSACCGTSHAIATGLLVIAYGMRVQLAGV